MLCSHTIFLSALSLFAQLDFADEPVPAPSPSRVDQVLRDWSEHSSKVRSLYAEFTRTSIDHAWKDRESAEGSARYRHPGVGRLDILGDDAETYILTAAGQIAQYKPPIYQMTIFDIRQLADPGYRDRWLRQFEWSLFLVVDGDYLKKKYHIEIIEENDETTRLRMTRRPNPAKATFWWFTIEDEPLVAEIWLHRTAWQPTRVQWKESNGNIVEFEFRGVWTNIEINPEDFVPKLIGNQNGKPNWRVLRGEIGDLWNRLNPPEELKEHDPIQIGCG